MKQMVKEVNKFKRNCALKIIKPRIEDSSTISDLMWRSFFTAASMSLDCISVKILKQEEIDNISGSIEKMIDFVNAETHIYFSMYTWLIGLIKNWRQEALSEELYESVRNIDNLLKKIYAIE